MTTYCTGDSAPGEFKLDSARELRATLLEDFHKLLSEKPAMVNIEINQFQGRNKTALPEGFPCSTELIENRDKNDKPSEKREDERPERKNHRRRTKKGSDCNSDRKPRKSDDSASRNKREKRLEKPRKSPDRSTDAPDTRIRIGDIRANNVNVFIVTPEQLPRAIADSCNVPRSEQRIPASQNLVSSIQHLFSPIDIGAGVVLPRFTNPQEAILDLQSIVSNGRGSYNRAVSPDQFISSLQRTMSGGDLRFLPPPPNPQRFIRELSTIVGYNQLNRLSMDIPPAPSPQQFHAGLARLMGGGGIPFGDTHMFRTLSPAHAMSGGADFYSPLPTGFDLRRFSGVDLPSIYDFTSAYNPIDFRPVNYASFSGVPELATRGTLSQQGLGSLDAIPLPRVSEVINPLSFLNNRVPILRSLPPTITNPIGLVDALPVDPRNIYNPISLVDKVDAVVPDSLKPITKAVETAVNPVKSIKTAAEIVTKPKESVKKATNKVKKAGKKIKKKIKKLF